MNLVVGYPIEHSLSPILHNEIYRRLKVSAKMEVISDSNIARLIKIIRRDKIGLAAVTMPHKQSIMEYLDEIDEDACAIGAVNTVINRRGRLYGYNTDIAGIGTALSGVSLKDKNVLLLGAGGAAKPAAYYVRKRGGNLYCRNRTEEKAKDLVQRFGGEAVGTDALGSLDISVIINATSIGMFPNISKTPLPKEMLKEGQIVFDMIYNPLETKLMTHAKEAGAKVISGLDMFIAQGLEQDRLWLETNIGFNIADFRPLLRNILKDKE